MRRDLPSGTVTFLFTDVEGSTRLLHELGAEAYADALAEHRRVIREACAAHSGVEVDTQGDAFFFAFPTAPGALAAAEEMTEALGLGPIQVRIGLHTGTPLLTEEGYVGGDVHFAARVAASSHGSQVVLSGTTAELVELSLTDLGEHRLKDIEGAVSIFQLGEKRFPPLKTISNTNLPRPASSFVGREKEVEELLSLLTDSARLLTLTGPGGSGKTRLAIEAAAELVSEFKAGVFWVGLAPLRDPALVTDTIAQTLGAKDGLADHIGERELLLLLDNLEQVVEAAPELASLVEACPNLKLLVTSRELLRVRGEVEYPVLPLAEPEAVELFCARAHSEPDETVEQLCRALDNLPLAVELAAARTKALSPAQILERLSSRLDLLRGGRDADPRQQTLRATIEWSYDLLSAEEQQLFARLSVFAGGCTLEAAEEVAEADLDTLQPLVDKSLIRHSDERFWMLETIREYAAERLEESRQAEELRQHHAEHFLALAEDAESHLATDAEWLDRLDVEVDNVRNALDFAAAGETQRVLRATAALHDFWFTRGYVSEGWTRLENALAADPQPTAARCRALIAASSAGVISGNEVTARARVGEALVISSALGDAHLSALARYEEACLLAGEEKWSPALEILEDVVPVLRGLGDWDMAIRANRTRAWTYEELGDKARFWALTEENLEHAKAHGHRRIEARSLGALSERAVSEGRFGEAHALLSQSCRIDLELGNLPFLSVDLVGFALVLARRGRPGVAAQLLARATVLRDEIGYMLESWMTLETEEALAAVHAQLDDSAFAEAWEQGAKLSLDEAIALALDSGPDA